MTTTFMRCTFTVYIQCAGNSSCGSTSRYFLVISVSLTKNHGKIKVIFWEIIMKKSSQLSQLSRLGQLGRLGRLSQLRRLSQLGQLRRLCRLGQLSQLRRISRLGPHEKLFSQYEIWTTILPGLFTVVFLLLL